MNKFKEGQKVKVLPASWSSGYAKAYDKYVGTEVTISKALYGNLYCIKEAPGVLWSEACFEDVSKTIKPKCKREEAFAAGAASDGKADSGKIMMSLLTVGLGTELKEIAEVLTYGANKYPSPNHDSWKNVPEAERRYSDALYRHLTAAMAECEVNDDESGMRHLAHAAANILFLMRLKSK